MVPTYTAFDQVRPGKLNASSAPLNAVQATTEAVIMEARSEWREITDPMIGEEITDTRPPTPTIAEAWESVNPIANATSTIIGASAPVPTA